MPSSPPRRRKPKAARKEFTLRLRVTAEQRRVLLAAAERDGLDLSGWLRSLGLRAAQRRDSSNVDRDERAEGRDGEE